MLLRFVLWPLLTLGSVGVGASIVAWLQRGGIGATLRTAGSEEARDQAPDRVLPGLGPLADAVRFGWHGLWTGAPVLGVPLAELAVGIAVALVTILVGARFGARHRRRYIRLRIAPYRTDRATPEAVVDMIEALHQRVAQRWWRRLVVGQPSVALEVHVLAGSSGALQAWMAVCCPHDAQAMVRAAIRSAYPNAHLRPFTAQLGRPPCVLRLKKRHEFIRRLALLERDGLERPLMDRLITTMAATGTPAFVQLALTPTPAAFERHAKTRFKEREKRLSAQREQGQHKPLRASSRVEDAELRGGLDVQHRPLCFADLRIVASTRRGCEQIASELRAEGAENRLVERGTTIRQALFRWL